MSFEHRTVNANRVPVWEGAGVPRGIANPTEKVPKKVLYWVCYSFGLDPAWLRTKYKNTKNPPTKNCISEGKINRKKCFFLSRVVGEKWLFTEKNVKNLPSENTFFPEFVCVVTCVTVYAPRNGKKSANCGRSFVICAELPKPSPGKFTVSEIPRVQKCHISSQPPFDDSSLRDLAIFLFEGRLTVAETRNPRKNSHFSVFSRFFLLFFEFSERWNDF